MSSISDFTGATVAEVDAYVSARGLSGWGDATTEEKTQALLRAWDYLESLRWAPTTFEGLSELPDDIKTAHILSAIEEEREPGIFSPSITRENYLEKKNIGGVIIKQYASGAPTVKRFSHIDRLLTGYVVSSINVSLVRG